MDITEIFGYIQVVPLGISLCIGFIIKYAVTSEYVNRFIPIICGIVGVIVSVWMCDVFTADVLLSGLISGLAATGLYEAFRQIIENGLTNSGSSTV